MCCRNTVDTVLFEILNSMKPYPFTYTNHLRPAIVVVRAKQYRWGFQPYFAYLMFTPSTKLAAYPALFCILQADGRYRVRIMFVCRAASDHYTCTLLADGQLTLGVLQLAAMTWSWKWFKVSSLHFSGFGQVGTHHHARNSLKNNTPALCWRTRAARGPKALLPKLPK